METTTDTTINTNEKKLYSYKRKYISRKTGEVKYHNIKVNYEPKNKNYRKKKELTNEQIIEIEKLLKLGVPVSKISKDFDTTVYRVRKIAKDIK